MTKDNNMSKLVKTFLEDTDRIYEDREQRLENISVFDSLKKRGTHLEKLLKKVSCESRDVFLINLILSKVLSCQSYYYYMINWCLKKTD